MSLSRPPLLIDDREDDKLVRALTSYDVPLYRTRLEFGDACWEGSGPLGPCLVGFERKRLTDLISSMQNRRLQGFQLIGMRQTYDFCFLIIEGMWRPTQAGGLEQHNGQGWEPVYHKQSGVEYRQVDGFIDSLELRAGVMVIRSSTVYETAAIYANRYVRWQRDWFDHRSHDQIYSPDPSAQYEGKASWRNQEPGMVERFAAVLPHCDRRSWDVGRHFKTIYDAVVAEEEEWMTALDIKKGKKIVQDIRRAIRGTNNGH